jgi:hypothetical protein
MPDPDPAPYQLHEPSGWAKEVARFHQKLVGTTTVVLRGKCPECEHEISVELPIESRSGNPLKNEERDNEPLKNPFVLVAACNCQEKHPNRPADLWGCGAFGALEVGASDG